MIYNQNGEAFSPTERGVWYERICLLDGNRYRHELPLTLESFQESYDRMRSGVVIQEAFPTLSPQDRDGAARAVYSIRNYTSALG